MGFGVTFSVLCGLLGIFQNQPYAGIFLLGFALLCVWGVFESSGELIVSEEGLLYIRAFGLERQVSWDRIDKTRWNGPMCRLELHDRDTGVMIPVSYALKGYREVIELLRSRRPDLFSAGSQKTFKRKHLMKVYLYSGSVVMIGFAIFVPEDGDLWGRFFFLAIAACGCLTVLFAEAESITLESDVLVIRYPLREKRLDRREVSKVRLERERWAHGYHEDVAVIYLKNGKRKEFGGFLGGNIRFFNAVESWLHNTR
jgi:hypothetical protein